MEGQGSLICCLQIHTRELSLGSGQIFPCIKRVKGRPEELKSDVNFLINASELRSNSMVSTLTAGISLTVVSLTSFQTTIFLIPIITWTTHHTSATTATNGSVVIAIIIRSVATTASGSTAAGGFLCMLLVKNGGLRMEKEKNALKRIRQYTHTHTYMGV